MTDVVVTPIANNTVVVSPPVGSTSASTVVDVGNATTGPQGIQGIQGIQGNAAQSFSLFSLQGNVFVYSGTNRFYFEQAYTLNKIRASVATAPTGSGIVIAVNINGTLSSTITIPAGSNTATTAPLTTISAGDYATISITSVGSTLPGTNLTVSLSIS